MMVALLVYAYAIGVRSSRAIERRCRGDVALRVIIGNQAPDHATIARFRVRHERAIGELRRQRTAQLRTGRSTRRTRERVETRGQIPTACPGVAIVCATAERHGGSMTASGATVRIAFPATPVPRAAAASPV
jgi:hypothetical protein